MHIRGDVFRKMVVNGRADMTPNPSAEAEAQLHLRYDLASQTADRYAEAGFDAVVQDVIVGANWPDSSAGSPPRPATSWCSRPA